MREMSESTCSEEEERHAGADGVDCLMCTWLSKPSHCSPRCRRTAPPRVGRHSGSPSVGASDALGLAHATPHATGRENEQRRISRASGQSGEAGGIPGTIQVLVKVTGRLCRIDFRGCEDFALYDEWGWKKVRFGWDRITMT